MREDPMPDGADDARSVEGVGGEPGEPVDRLDDRLRGLAAAIAVPPPPPVASLAARRAHPVRRSSLLVAAAVAVVVAVVAAGAWVTGGSDPVDLDVGQTPVVEGGGPEPSGTAPPDTATSTTIVADPPIGPDPDGATDADLVALLASAGADIPSAPRAAVALGDAALCGLARSSPPTEQVDDPTSAAALRCFADHHAGGRPAVLVEVLTTVEGDPVVVVHRSRADGTYDALVDSSRDHFGIPGWAASSCTGLEVTDATGGGGAVVLAPVGCTDGDLATIDP